MNKESKCFNKNRPIFRRPPERSSAFFQWWNRWIWWKSWNIAKLWKIFGILWSLRSSRKRGIFWSYNWRPPLHFAAVREVKDFIRFSALKKYFCLEKPLNYNCNRHFLFFRSFHSHAFKNKSTINNSNCLTRFISFKIVI